MNVEIDGLQVEVNQERASDWHAFNLIRKAGTVGQMEQIDILFEFVEYVTDQTQDTIIAHLGGDTAQVKDVVSMLSKLVEAATPKN